MNKEFDNGIKVGDIVTGYHKGYHRVVNVERRFYTKSDAERMYGIQEGDEHSSLIHYETLADANGKLRKKPGKPICCDAAYCVVVTKRRVEREYEKELEKVKSKFENINTLL